eukprot:1171582-Amphidinium_carterae.1
MEISITNMEDHHPRRIQNTAFLGGHLGACRVGKSTAVSVCVCARAAVHGTAMALNQQMRKTLRADKS